MLPKEAGIDPAILDLLRRNPAIVAELTSRLSASPTPEPEPSAEIEPGIDEASDGNMYDGAKDLYGDDMPDIPPSTPDPDGGDGVGTSRGGSQGNEGGHGTDVNKGGGKGREQGKRTPGHAGGRPSISSALKNRKSQWRRGFQGNFGGLNLQDLR